MRSLTRAVLCLATAVPPHLTPRQHRAFLDAVAVAGVSGKVFLVSSLTAAVVAYAKKHRQAITAECATADATAAAAAAATAAAAAAAAAPAMTDDEGGVVIHCGLRCR